MANQGFASMDDEQQKDIASMGGSASSGNFKNDPQRASKTGKKGAAAQPTAAKAKGGRNSRRTLFLARLSKRGPQSMRTSLFLITTELTY